MGAQETVGKLIDATEKRDAIHVAVEPAIAEQDLAPGEHVGFGTKGMKRTPNSVGIVDPYLTERVKKGQRFWLFVYPRQVTSLRHVWSHPYFDDETPPPPIPVEKLHPESVEYLETFARSIERSYDDLLEHALQYTLNGSYWHGGESFEGVQVPDEFWEHFENVMGEKVPKSKQGNFFSCSC